MISELTPDACKRVAELHMKNVRTRYSGYAGSQMLRIYYANLMQGLGGKCFVAENDGSVDGFVCGIWDSKAISTSLRRHMWASLCFWGVMQFVVSPTSIIFNLRDLIRKESSLSQNRGGYEVRPIVVSPGARGSGVAGMLLNRLMDHAASIGYSKIFLYCETENPRAAAFYVKRGFREISRVARGGIDYIVFEHDLADLVQSSHSNGIQATP